LVGMILVLKGKDGWADGRMDSGMHGCWIHRWQVNRCWMDAHVDAYTHTLTHTQTHTHSDGYMHARMDG
jgi:hypothetical protein